MEKILIRFDERNFNIRKRSIDAMAIKLNDLMTAFYKLNIVSKDGINLNELLHNDNYINELISQRSDVAKLNFKNISELHKLFLEQNAFIHFNEVRTAVLTEFKKAHIPLNYFTLANGLISVNEKEVLELQEHFKKYTDNDQEVQAYKELKKLTDSINDLIDNMNEISRKSVISPRGFNMSLLKFDSGDVRPSLEGVQLIAKHIKLINNETH